VYSAIPQLSKAIEYKQQGRQLPTLLLSERYKNALIWEGSLAELLIEQAGNSAFYPFAPAS
jgi:hypothetical protein